MSLQQIELGEIDQACAITGIEGVIGGESRVGGNPAQAGTPGGGSGGAIYNDGNTMTLSLCGTTITDNSADAGDNGGNDQGGGGEQTVLLNETRSNFFQMT